MTKLLSMMVAAMFTAVSVNAIAASHAGAPDKGKMEDKKPMGKMGEHKMKKPMGKMGEHKKAHKKGKAKMEKKEGGDAKK